MDLGLIGGIAEGLKSGVQAYQTQDELNAKKKRDLADALYRQKKDDELREYQQAILKQKETHDQLAVGQQNKKLSVDMAKEGLIEGPDGKIIRDPNWRPPEDVAIKRMEAREGLQKKQALEKVQVPEFEVQEGYLPSPKDAETVKAQHVSVKNIRDRINNIKALVDSAGAARFLPSETKKAIQEEYGNLKVQLKNAAELGALTGPDVQLLEETTPDPTSYWNVYLDKDKIKNLYSRASNSADKAFENVVASRGYKPKGLVAPPPKDVVPPVQPPGSASATPRMSDDEIKQAKLFITMNPGDPSAKAIKEQLDKLGVK